MAKQMAKNKKPRMMITLLKPTIRRITLQRRWVGMIVWEKLWRRRFQLCCRTYFCF